jgi:hypothetical protein
VNNVTVIENYVTFRSLNEPTFINNSKCTKMANTVKMKISWKNDLQKSVVEQDVLKLRNKLKNIQSSPELKKEDYRLNTQLREQKM